MLTRLSFYLNLYLQYLGLTRPRFVEFLPTIPDSIPPDLHIHFWTPIDNSGARVIVHDMLPSLRELIHTLGLNWRVDVAAELPSEPVDWLVCFKSVPHRPLIGSPKIAMLICDQADVFWMDLPNFDAVISTSSRPFTGLVAARNRNTAFISESEPVEHLDFGTTNLSRLRAHSREPILLWHGGLYSQDALMALRPVLERFAASRKISLHIVSGRAAMSEEVWGGLRVTRYPWSMDQLRSSASIARLALIPARSSVRSSWIKPASRVRCLYALGVPTIGDARVPDVKDFMSRFDGPVAGSDSDWSDRLNECWESPNLADIAQAGHAAVQNDFTTQHTARQWLHFFSQESAK